jgi:hypothetical protein
LVAVSAVKRSEVESPTWRLFSRPLPIAPCAVSGCNASYASFLRDLAGDALVATSALTFANRRNLLRFSFGGLAGGQQFSIAPDMLVKTEGIGNFPSFP